jgi:hypothetical protein
MLCFQRSEPQLKVASHIFRINRKEEIIKETLKIDNLNDKTLKNYNRNNNIKIVTKKL